MAEGASDRSRHARREGRDSPRHQRTRADRRVQQHPDEHREHPAPRIRLAEREDDRPRHPYRRHEQQSSCDPRPRPGRRLCRQQDTPDTRRPLDVPQRLTVRQFRLGGQRRRARPSCDRTGRRRSSRHRFVTASSVARIARSSTNAVRSRSPASRATTRATHSRGRTKLTDLGTLGEHWSTAAGDQRPRHDRRLERDEQRPGSRRPLDAPQRLSPRRAEGQDERGGRQAVQLDDGR